MFGRVWLVDGSEWIFLMDELYGIFWVGGYQKKFIMVRWMWMEMR